jgi:hypothetical protein
VAEASFPVVLVFVAQSGKKLQRQLLRVRCIWWHSAYARAFSKWYRKANNSSADDEASREVPRVSVSLRN